MTSYGALATPPGGGSFGSWGKRPSNDLQSLQFGLKEEAKTYSCVDLKKRFKLGC